MQTRCYANVALRLFHQENHAEGEQLRSALQEKKEEVTGIREETLLTVREDEVRRHREELEELRARSKALEVRRGELLMELQEAHEARKEAEEKRSKAEAWWRSTTEEMEKEQELKVKDLRRQIQLLQEVKEKTMAVQRSGMEEGKEEEEDQSEFSSISSSSTIVRATAPMSEEQKIHTTSSLAAERVGESEEVHQRRRSHQEKEDKGEVSVCGAPPFLSVQM